MRLILNKALDNINDNVNLKIIEITSTDFLNNDLDYFVYKYQIPLIKFTDTEEIFNIKNFKIELSSSLSETELILTESDLELLSGGSGGGTQDLQSVLNEGTTAILNSDLTISGTTKKINFGTEDSNDLDSICMSLSGNSYWDIGQRISIYKNNGKASLDFDENGANFNGTSTDGFRSGHIYLGGGSVNGEGIVLEGVGKSAILNTKITNPSKYFKLDLNADTNSAIFKDTTDIPKGLEYDDNYSSNYTNRSLVDKEYVDTSLRKINLDSRVHANNAAAISGGLTANDLYRTSTGELRIVV